MEMYAISLGSTAHLPLHSFGAGPTEGSGLADIYGTAAGQSLRAIAIPEESGAEGVAHAGMLVRLRLSNRRVPREGSQLRRQQETGGDRCCGGQGRQGPEAGFGGVGFGHAPARRG